MAVRCELAVVQNVQDSWSQNSSSCVAAGAEDQPGEAKKWLGLAQLAKPSTEALQTALGSPVPFLGIDRASVIDTASVIDSASVLYMIGIPTWESGLQVQGLGSQEYQM